MNIGELFLNLGIKGTDKTVSSLATVSKGMGDVKSMSLEAKAGILAALYGFEQMIAASAKGGMALQQFGNATGLSTIYLQNLQNAARQVGIATETTTSTVVGLRKAMADMILGGGAPKFIGMFKNFGIAFDPTKIRDTYYMIQKMTELARAAPPDIMLSLMPGFEGFFSQLKNFKGNLFNNKAGVVESPDMIKKNAAADVAGLNLADKTKHIFDYFTSQHGKDILDDITKIADQFMRMSEAITKIGEKMGVFSLLGGLLHAVAGAAGIVTGEVDVFSGKKLTEEDYKNMGVFGKMMKWRDDFEKMPNGGKPLEMQLEDKAANLKPIWDEHYYKRNSAPASPATRPGSSHHEHKTEVNMNFQHEGKDHVKTGQSVQKAINVAYRQFQSQIQGA